MAFVAKRVQINPPHHLSDWSARFSVGEKVNVYWPKHTTGTYQVKATRAHKDGKSTQYQLADDDSQALYENGAWVDEEHLDDA